MTTAAIREKLQDYIRYADDKKVKAIYTILEDEIETEYKWFEDKEFVAELENEYNNAITGRAKTYGRTEIEISLKKLKSKLGNK